LGPEKKYITADIRNAAQANGIFCMTKSFEVVHMLKEKSRGILAAAQAFFSYFYRHKWWSLTKLFIVGVIQ